MSQNGIQTATVETLTAEVRVLMVGGRQITLSVARQLDIISQPQLMRPFGRINLPGAALHLAPSMIIGAHAVTNALSLAYMPSTGDGWPVNWPPRQELSLIVLAGLK